MKIGILTSSVSGKGTENFYNAQDVGLAKALLRQRDIAERCEQIVIYRATDKEDLQTQQRNIEEENKLIVKYMTVRTIGSSGLIDVNELNESIYVLIHFADTQISVPKVYKWAMKHNIKYIPYIGVTESHSIYTWSKMILDMLWFRNVSVYRKCHCCVKTNVVKEKLEKRGIKKISIAPVGLDESLLKDDYEIYSIEKIKRDNGYCLEDKVVLYIGRLTKEKQPLKMIELFMRLKKYSEKYKLLMIGKGELESCVKAMITENALEDSVKLINQIPNNDIWKLYRIADCFVNLNQQEIYGMALLEAMYYGCKVIAWHAAGPDYIIEDGVTGYLADSDEQVYQLILHSESVSENSKKTICEKFLWSGTAEIIRRVVCEEENEEL